MTSLLQRLVSSCRCPVLMTGKNNKMLLAGTRQQQPASKQEQEYHDGSRACRATGLFRRGHIHFNNKKKNQVITAKMQTAFRLSRNMSTLEVI